MIKTNALENLFETIKALNKANQWLKRSFEKCSSIGIKSDYTGDEWDSFEALCSRYARVTDILINKAFRAIDAVEFESGGTMIDVINRAHKRNLFKSVDEIREIKDVRNEIAHEYIQSELIGVFSDVMRFAPVLFALIDKLMFYCEKYGSNTNNKDT